MCPGWNWGSPKSSSKLSSELVPPSILKQNTFDIFVKTLDCKRVELNTVDLSEKRFLPLYIDGIIIAAKHYNFWPGNCKPNQKLVEKNMGIFQKSKSISMYTEHQKETNRNYVESRRAKAIRRKSNNLCSLFECQGTYCWYSAKNCKGTYDFGFIFLFLNLKWNELSLFIFFFFSLCPVLKRSWLILIGCAMLFGQRLDLDAVARLPNHHLTYQVIVVSVGLLAFSHRLPCLHQSWQIMEIKYTNYKTIPSKTPFS